MRAPADPEILKLGTDMLQFTCGIDKLETPHEVLDSLHKVTSQDTRLNVLGATMLPLHWGDWSSLEKGKTVFLHRSVPDGWWEEHTELSRTHPGWGFFFAQFSLAPFTMSEVMRMIEPLASERWPFEVALKYGMRDRLNCPVGGRWVVSYWSKSVLTSRLSEKARVILFMGATFAAIRLQTLVSANVNRVGSASGLTPRELAVLRLMSFGNQVKDAADALGLGEETVRSHLKKAQMKLGARSRTHAVALAIRRRLMP